MSTLNANPDASDTSSHTADGLYTAMPPECEMSPSPPKSADAELTASRWADGLRCTVRDNPLAAVASAAVLGMMLARLAR